MPPYWFERCHLRCFAGCYGEWLPLRDIVTLLSWAQAFTKRTVVWRGVTYRLVGGGRMVPMEERSSALG
ncbi:MAG: hypothetical protein ACFCVA_09760 [Gammaproteobacteria bacterium]